MNHTIFRRSLSFVLALAMMLLFCTAAFAAEQTAPTVPSDTPGFTLVEIKGTDVVMEGNEFPYTGQPIEPAVTVTVDGKVPEPKPAPAPKAAPAAEAPKAEEPKAEA